MDGKTTLMEIPVDFPFPFPPYSIQKDFMKNLYHCIENGKLGIFESPTGTGKTLSVICGAVKWLLDKKEWDKKCLISKIEELDKKILELDQKNQNDWFAVQTSQNKIKEEKNLLQANMNSIKTQEKKMEDYKDLAKLGNLKKSKGKYLTKKKEGDEKLDRKEEMEVLDDYDLLLEEFFTRTERDEEEEDEKEKLKIFFCSRTHSQLSQFVGELKRSPYADKISLVSLASRQSYCINAEVKKLGTMDALNDRCLQMQKGKKTTGQEEKSTKKAKTSSQCPFMPGDQEYLVASILTELKDVEEVVSEAKKIDSCSYYASKKSIKDAEIVLLPYNSILHKNTRDSLGINLKNNVVIIDEAHNLLEAIERMHTVTINGRNILHSLNQLTQYQNRFNTMFSAKNVLNLSQLSFCLKRFLNILGGNSKSHPSDKSKIPESPKTYKIEDFEVESEIDAINVFELVKFVKYSKLVHKLRGFVEKYEAGVVLKKTEPKSGISVFLNQLENAKNGIVEPEVEEMEEQNEQPKNPLMSIVAFLETLKNYGNGRIFLIPGATIGQSVLKFLLLNPASHFSDIVKDARAVILAGGTMAPISEFRDQLFIGAGAEPERIFPFSCDHIVSTENILTTIQTHGPTGTEFEFNFKNRENPKMLDELGRTLVNFTKIIPAGIVVFLPSYNFEKMLYSHFESSGILKVLETKKMIFREPKLTTQVGSILEKYGEAIKNPKSSQNGALLFSVVGGKLSEGLNFSDDLGRCVIVVGMPYPNIKSPELQEKMKYLNQSVKPGAGNTFYENSCMKAVNQCIGRAVRHINDYSTVVLLDKRYTGKVKSLPNWIQRTTVINNSFGATIGKMAKFFAQKRKSSVHEKVGIPE